MNPPSSSISSSSAAAAHDAPQPNRRGAIWATVFWTIAGLILLDVLVNVLFAYPSDPRVIDPSHLQLYFDYGRSTEAKLRRMTRADPAVSAPITLSGWYAPLTAVERPKPEANETVTFYGMSHAVRLADALDRTSDRFKVRSVGAPGATTNWSYGAFLRDRGGGKSKVVVLAIMSITVPEITTMSAMTWNVSFPMPYTEDRFYLKDGRLGVIHPPYESAPDYVRTFDDPTKWAAASADFRKHDPLYDPILMRANIFDHSALARLLRRAYGQRLQRGIGDGVFDTTGFNPNAEQIQVANAIVRSFADEARKGGMIPVIFIANNLGYSDFLYEALRGTLETDHIPYLSSHTIVSPSDPRGYLPDSHFTDANDDRLARALVGVIDQARWSEAQLSASERK